MGVPIWLTAVIAVGSPLVAVVGLVLARLAAREVDVRWQREETMRLLRWAGELAASEQPVARRLGLRALQALGRSPLLLPADLDLVGSVLREAVEVDVS